MRLYIYVEQVKEAYAGKLGVWLRNGFAVIEYFYMLKLKPGT